MADGNITLESAATDFGALKSGLPGADVPWFAALRDAGMERFTATGLPARNWESWKYTNLNSIANTPFRLAEREPGAVADQIPSLLGDGGGPRLVFVNGRFDAGLSHLGVLPEGVRIEPLADALIRDAADLEAALIPPAAEERQPLLDLNTAFASDGVVVRIGKGVALENVLEVIFFGAAAEGALTCHPRSLIVLEDGSQASILEHHFGLGDGQYFTNSVLGIRLGSGATLRHCKVQEENPHATHISTTRASLADGAAYDGFILSLGAGLSRHDVSVRLEGEGAVCRLNGAMLMRGRQHCDITTRIEHVAPGTACSEVFKNVLDDRARGVFQGTIVVDRDAQGTDGHQLCKTLILSDEAEMDAKPELEIYADDVKCSHGATMGDMDAEALFYLRSRGVPEHRARDILIESFLAETLDHMEITTLRGPLLAKIADWLGKRPAGEDHE